MYYEGGQFNCKVSVGGNTLPFRGYPSKVAAEVAYDFFSYSIKGSTYFAPEPKIQPPPTKPVNLFF